MSGDIISSHASTRFLFEVGYKYIFIAKQWAVKGPQNKQVEVVCNISPPSS